MVLVCLVYSVLGTSGKVGRRKRKKGRKKKIREGKRINEIKASGN